MNESFKSVITKLALTIPALLVGILSAILIILKPAIELWSPKKEVYIPVPLEEDTQENHTFM